LKNCSPPHKKIAIGFDWLNPFAIKKNSYFLIPVLLCFFASKQASKQACLLACLLAKNQAKKEIKKSCFFL